MIIKKTGQVERWDDKKGFGFIETNKGESVFFHISQFKSSKRPSVNDNVEFVIRHDKQGRLRAEKINLIGQTQQKPNKQSKQYKQTIAQKDFVTHQRQVLFLSMGLYLCLTILILLNQLNWLILGWYVLLGVATFFVYFKDKVAAGDKTWRTPESTLHLLSILGGWVGALLAQTYLRHKSQKTSFKFVFYLTIIINLVILMAFILKLHESVISSF